MEGTRYSVLLATEKSLEESIMAKRLLEDCSVVVTNDRSKIAEDIQIRAIPFSAYIIDTADIDKETIEFVQTIRELDPTGDAPVILIVDDISDDLINKGFDAGATDVIVRPYSIYAHRRVLNYIALHETARSYQESLKELHMAREELDTVLSCTPGGIFRYVASYEPGKDVFDYLSPGLVQMLGCKDEEDFRNYTGNTFRGFVHPDDRDKVIEEIQEQVQIDGKDKCTYRIIRRDGEIRWLEDWGNLIVDSDGTEWFYVVVLDITEKIKSEEGFKKRAERDDLTGIFNREAAIERVEEKRKVVEGPCSLLLIDVDDFKSINDTYGHPFGDQVLSHFATFLDSVLRDSDVVARMGGDEFAAFVIGLGEGDRLRYLVKRISETAFQDFDSMALIGEEVHPTVSIGIASADDASTSVDELYKMSDEALYNTKREGKNGYSFHSEEVCSQ